MNPKVKEKWINALLSGEYTQCTGSLKDENGNFCVLGVLTDLAIKENKAFPWVKDSVFTMTFYISPDFEEGSKRAIGVLSVPVMNWSELDNVKSSELWKMNDYDRKSFKELAEIIKNHL